MDVDGRRVVLRTGSNGPIVTDEGHYIVDLHLGRIGDPAALAAALVAIPGVVETGLFIGTATSVILGRPRRIGGGALPSRRRARRHRRADAQPGRLRRGGFRLRPLRDRRRVGRSPRRPHRRGGRGVGRARRGVPLRRHLRHPRLRPEEAAGLRLLLSRCLRGRQGLRLDGRAAALRLEGADRRQGRRDRPARGDLPRQPATGRACRPSWPTPPSPIPTPSRSPPVRSTARSTSSSRPAAAPSCPTSPARSSASPRTRCSASPVQPKRLAIVGGGYVACEFAGIMNGLGTEVIQLYRGDQILRGFDDDLRDHVADAMRDRGDRARDPARHRRARAGRRRPPHRPRQRREPCRRPGAVRHRPQPQHRGPRPRGARRPPPRRRRGRGRPLVADRRALDLRRRRRHRAPRADPGRDPRRPRLRRAPSSPAGRDRSTTT